MRKPDTDPDSVEMSDVLCDFCHREWTEDIPMVEGHQGSCICGQCLTVAYHEVLVTRTAPSGKYTCTMCLEKPDDRDAEGRPDEPGWQSPACEDAAICRRCIKRASGTLHKDPDFNWRKPDAA